MARTFKGHVARVSTGLLQLLNTAIIIAAVGTIVISVYLERPPSRIGWCFIGVGIVSAVSGLFGVWAAKSTGCFSWHLIALLFSAGGLFSAALVIFIRTTQVIDNMKSKQGKDTRKLVKLNGSIFFIMGCVQAVILVLAIIASCCEFVDYYEGLEMSNRRSDMAGMADESSRRTAKKKDTKASKLADTMKQKYGKWSRNSDFAAAK